MIKAMVIDDEWYNLEETSEFVENTGFFHVTGKYQNPIKALEEVTSNYPQVAFVDIELPEMDGITFAEKLLEINPSMIIVFITSYNQYAVQAFDLNAMDYILKPIKSERFNRMVEKIKNEVSLRPQNTSQILKIKCFNHLTVTIGDIPVKWERAKAEELFAYLLMYHGSYVHKEKIIENLWAGYKPEKALQILQTSVCKIRNLFSQIKNVVSLNYSGNRYCLIVEGGESDYLQVEIALSDYKADDKSTFDGLEKACNLFGKGFLTEEGYSWSLVKDQEMRAGLVAALKEIMNVYVVDGNQDKVIATLKSITKLAPYDKKSNFMLIRIYKESGDNTAAYNHYQWLEKILREEYDEAPSERIQAMLGVK